MSDARFMHTLIAGFGQQLREALGIAEKVSLRAADRPLHHVLVAGMGGSGIGASLVNAFVYDQLRVPLTVTKTYEVPAYVGKNTLFVAGSFSGNTEETLAATEKALERGAFVVGITSGGKLQALAEAHGFETIRIPGDSNSPRAGIGYSFVQLLRILESYGLIGPAYTAQMDAAAELIEQRAEQIHEQAKTIAHQCFDRLPIFYSDERLLPLMLRNQQQINENAKQLAHINAFPEMNHNELVGWRFPMAVLRQTVVLLVRSAYDHPRAAVRMDICKPLFAAEGATVHEVHAQGDSFIEQAVYLIHLFDWVSFYLAERNGVDPFPIGPIDYLKTELAKRA